jgi:DNA (cytosine-5)-methyltransferase 1
MTSAGTPDRAQKTIRRPAVRLYRGHDLELPPHPEAPDPTQPRDARRWVRTQAATGPTAIDLFCGAGGLSLGLQSAGFRILVGADNDARAVHTHAANIGGLTYGGDLSDPGDFVDHLQAWGIRQVELIAGGVPCQPFSRAGQSKLRNLIETGQRSIDDPRAELWRSFIDVVELLRPRAILLENVPDLAAWDEGAVLVGFCESLRDLGYLAEAAILQAYEHGVPQHRSRLFIVAVRPGMRFQWPTPQPTRPTIQQAIGDLPVVPPAQRDERIAYGHPRTALQRLLRVGVPESDRRVVHDHITRDVRPDDAEAFALMPEGGTYEELPTDLQRYRADIFSDKYKRLEWRGLSRSITAHIAKDGYWYIHPDQDRTLSIREAARIQTFPDWFRFSGQPSHRYRQIGNAVPPLLAQAIAEQLRVAVTGPRQRRATKRTGREFRSDLLAWHALNARDYPWRRRVDPWRVLMAEMCLHRTRADQVRPVYEALSALAPTPPDMLAHEDEALAVMRSLGLHWRARNVIGVARTLTDRHGGDVPSSDFELRQLPGVGDYVANAVVTFGFGRRAVIVDTNTQRIVGRVRNRDRTHRWQLRLDLHSLAGREGPDAAFNYALLDLGAQVCRAGTPLCKDCPVERHCATRAAAVAA